MNVDLPIPKPSPSLKYREIVTYILHVPRCKVYQCLNLTFEGLRLVTELLELFVTVSELVVADVEDALGGPEEVPWLLEATPPLAEVNPWLAEDRSVCVLKAVGELPNDLVPVPAPTDRESCGADETPCGAVGLARDEGK